MSDLHEFTGVVEDIQQKGNGPIRFALGYENGQFHNQKKFQVWQTDYETKQPNPAATTIQQSEGQTVTVRYSTKQETYNGKTFPKNTVHEVVGGGDPPPQGAAPPPEPAHTAPGQAPPASPSDLVSLISKFEAQFNETFGTLQEIKTIATDMAWNG